MKTYKEIENNSGVLFKEIFKMLKITPKHLINPHSNTNKLILIYNFFKVNKTVFLSCSV